MLITNKAQYTCHETLIWLRLSLTCSSLMCAVGGGMIFSLDKSTCLERGPQKKAPEMIKGGGGQEIIIAHPLDKL